MQTKTLNQIRNIKLHRGIDITFADNFKKSLLYKFYLEHSDELILAIRNGYISLYYNCDCIARVDFRSNGKACCKINKFYVDGMEKADYWDEKDIIEQYDSIKQKSDSRNSDEKKMQQKLFLSSNHNPSSKWFCLDIEWKKQFSNRTVSENNGFNGRFDIVAVSKDTPHKIALIELKYGDKALGGKSGILKHVSDFYMFCEKGYFKEFKQEIIDIIESYNRLAIPLTNSFYNMKEEDIAQQPLFYFITANNNIIGGRTPKQAMAAYLFNKNSEHYRNWKGKRPSPNNVEDMLGIDVLDSKSKLPITFLFTHQTIDTLSIGDIINYKYEECIEPI